MKKENTCKICLNKFPVSPHETKREFCSHKCYWKSLKGKSPFDVSGTKQSRETLEKRKIATAKTIEKRKKLKMMVGKTLRVKNLLGERHGKPCLICKKLFFFRESRKNDAKFCSHKCYSKSLEGKIAPNKGIKRPECSRENHPRWVVDRNKLQKYGDDNKDRRSSIYRNWRMNVWIRDNFKCRIANQDCDGRIEAHHVLGWTKFVELRYEVNNGITLCHAHHPRRRAEEKRLIPVFQGLVSVSKVNF